MAYKDRVQKVKLLDMELGVRRELLQLSVSERADYLSRQSPWVLLGSAAIGGVVAGMMSTRMGATKAVRRLVSLSVSAFRLWPSVSRWIVSTYPVE